MSHVLATKYANNLKNFMNEKKIIVEKLNDVGVVSCKLLEKMHQNEEVDIFSEVYKINQAIHELKKMVSND